MDYFEHEENHKNLSAVLYITAMCLAAEHQLSLVRFTLVQVSGMGRRRELVCANGLTLCLSFDWIEPWG